MKKDDQLISLIKQEKIVDNSTLKTAIEKHEETGQSLITILKKDNLLDEEQLTKIIAHTNKIEFVNLAPEMVDPMVAHLITYDIASKYKKTGRHTTGCNEFSFKFIGPRFNRNEDRI